MEFFPKAVTLCKISLILAIVFISFTAQFGLAIRPYNLQEEKLLLLKKIVPNLESLYKGPVPPSDHTPCSNIPRSGKCVVNEMNVAGRLIRSPPPFPAGMNVKEFAAAVATSVESMSNN
ncbi:hypothetical protein REPUB_Repub15cG0050400 [Reevesia pubescens]